jgi:hypothetical protein
VALPQEKRSSSDWARQTLTPQVDQQTNERIATLEKEATAANAAIAEADERTTEAQLALSRAKADIADADARANGAHDPAVAGTKTASTPCSARHRVDSESNRHNGTRQQRRFEHAPCTSLKADIFLHRLSALPPCVAKRSIGPLHLRGRESEMALYALTAATATTPASSEVTALSSRSG